MRAPSKRLVCTLVATACFGLVPFQGGIGQGAEAALPFTSMQQPLFSLPGSLANAWGDFDNDGDLDLAVSIKSGEIRLYRNDSGVMTSVGSVMGLPTKGASMRGLSWGDYDGDGWIDLLAGSETPDKVSAVFHNDHGKMFTDVASAIGLTLPGRSSRQNNWVDYDNDGDLDLYAADRIGENKLYRNDGGKFTQVFATEGPTTKRSTVGACWFDYNKDGKLDLFLANQSGATDALYRNDGDKFTDVAPQLGLDNPGRSKDEGGVGCAIGDYDNDGNLDIFVPNYGRNTLYHNNGDGTFTNVAKEMGVDLENHAVGSSWGDYDNDGYLDLVVTSYEGERGVQTPKDSLFHNEAGKRFVQVLTKTSPLNAGDHGVEWIDYNKDGAIDLSIDRGYSDKGGHFLFRNDIPKAAARRSLSVIVLDAKGHYTRFGSEVRLYDAAGKILATRLVPAGGGYNVENAAPVHFGLKTLAPVMVEVTFMSNHSRKVQKIAKVSPAAYYGKLLTVKEAK